MRAGRLRAYAALVRSRAMHGSSCPGFLLLLTTFDYFWTPLTTFGYFWLLLVIPAAARTKTALYARALAARPPVPYWGVAVQGTARLAPASCYFGLLLTTFGYFWLLLATSG